MQIFTACCGNMKRYRRRRRYRRLRNAVTNEQNDMVSMGKRLKFGKIRVTPKLNNGDDHLYPKTNASQFLARK
ncbi:hypothetical protein ACFX13_016151 [Malus domestica]